MLDESTGGLLAEEGRYLEKKALRRSANQIGAGLLLVHGIGVGASWVLRFWLYNLLPSPILEKNSDLLFQSADLFLYLLSFVIPCAFIAYWTRLPARAVLPFRKTAPTFVIASVFISLGMSIPGGYLSQLTAYALETIFHITPTMPDMTAPGTPGSYAVYFVNMAVAAAFLEEMVFRGVILQSLRRFGDGFALIVSSILFAMVHGNLVQGPNTLVLGLVIGYFVLVTDSLWTGVVIHFANNALAVAMELGFSYTGVYPWLEDFLNNAYFMIYIAGAIVALFYLLNSYSFSNRMRLAHSHSGMSVQKRILSFFTAIAPILLVLVTIAVTAMYMEPV